MIVEDCLRFFACLSGCGLTNHPVDFDSHKLSVFLNDERSLVMNRFGQIRVEQFVEGENEAMSHEDVGRIKNANIYELIQEAIEPYKNFKIGDVVYIAGCGMSGTIVDIFQSETDKVLYEVSVKSILPSHLKPKYLTRDELVSESQRNSDE